MWEVTDARRVNLWGEIPILFFIPNLSLAELQNHSVSSFSQLPWHSVNLPSFVSVCLSLFIYLLIYLLVY